MSQSQFKKVRKIWVREQFKNTERTQKEAEDDARREKNIEEAKKVKIQLDPSLPDAVKVSNSLPCLSIFFFVMSQFCVANILF